MSVVTRNRSVMERLTGSGKPRPSSFDRVRPKEAVAAGRLTTAMIIGGAFLAAIGVGWMAMGPAVSPASFPVGRVATSLTTGLFVLAAIAGVMMRTRRILSSLQQAADAMKSVTAASKDGDTGAGGARKAPTAGVGRGIFWIAILLLSFMTPMLELLSNPLGAIVSGAVSFLPFVLVIWLLGRGLGLLPRVSS